MKAFISIETAAGDHNIKLMKIGKDVAKNVLENLIEKPRSYASYLVSQLVTIVLNLYNLYVLNVLKIRNEINYLKIYCYAKF